MTSQSSEPGRTLSVIRIVRMSAPSEQIIGPFDSTDTAFAWLDENRPRLDLHPYVAPQIMPLTAPARVVTPPRTDSDSATPLMESSAHYTPEDPS
jgi:hypothetical protein